jgi:hypothetical protein
MPLHPGDKVTIYEDPFSRTMPEGTATLIAKENTYSDGIERWLVQFPGEAEIFSRTILVKEETHAPNIT